ncbi:MAG: MATE family efflux transporter [Actinomycetota bacterium]|nr:MATE family efflux transporter [Actinomycetota bacterium]
MVGLSDERTSRATELASTVADIALARPLAHPYDRQILGLAVPALGALAAEPLYVLADTAVVGHLGTPQLGGLAVASTLLLTGYAVFNFLAYGTTASVARRIGAGDDAGAAHEGVQGLWLALAIGVVLALVGAALAPQLVGLMGARGAVAANALVYLRISLVGVPALLVGLAGTGYLRGRQNTITPLVVTGVAVAANLAIELVLIYGVGLGIGASALATVVAQVGSAIAYVRWVARDVAALGVAVGPELAAIRRLAAVGRDLFVRTAALRLALTLATAVAARLGTVDLGAHQIAFEVWSFLALALDSLAIAGQAMVGRLLGADDATAARDAARRMLTWGVGAGVVFAVTVGLARPVLPGLFSDDPAVIALCAFVLIFVAVLQPLNAVVFVLDGVLIGAGDMRFLAWAMAGAAVVFVPAAAAVLALGAGIGWLWASLALLMAARAAALLWRFRGDAWVVEGIPASQ